MDVCGFPCYIACAVYSDFLALSKMAFVVLPRSGPLLYFVQIEGVVRWTIVVGRYCLSVAEIRVTSMYLE